MDEDDIIFAKRYSVAATSKEDRVNLKNKREIKVEYANLRGVRKRVFRMYERHGDSFGGVGWIVNDDIDECMVCGNEFYFFRRKHHCRSCGNLVCDSCSPHYVVVEELKELGEVRVCVQCYWGQYPVYAARERVDSDSDDESEEEEDECLDMAIASSQINASINSSTKTLNVEVEDFLEYCEMVVLETSLPWDGICSAIWIGLGMPAHMQADFEYFVVVDEDGDEISPTITDAESFWKHSVDITVTNKNKLVACVPPPLKQNLFQHRKKLLLEMKSPGGKGYQSLNSSKSEDSIVEEVSRNATENSSSTCPTTPVVSSSGESSGRSLGKNPKRRSSISMADEVLISLSRLRAQENEQLAKRTSPTSQEEVVSNYTDEEDVIEDVDFSALALAEGPTPIVNVNHKDHTVVVQLKNGKTNKMSKSDSESLLLARRAITETYYQNSTVSSPAIKPVVDKVDNVEETSESMKVAPYPAKTDEESETNLVKVAPRLINSFHKELRSAFDELAQLSRVADSSIGHDKLSMNTFMNWQEVKRAVSEIATLDAAVIEEEFKTIASSNSQNSSSYQFHPPLLDFEGFCLLMERLETLGERRSVTQEYELEELPTRTHSRRYSVSTMDLPGELAPLPDDSDDMMVPEELIDGYHALEIISNTVDGKHQTGHKGVSLAAILLWDNLQEALGQGVLQAEDVISLFNKAIEGSRGTESIPQHPHLTLKEFYSFAVKLQVFVDERCGAW